MGHEVQQTRWDRIVRRVSGSIGPGSRVSETLSELFPTLDVENVPAELLALGGTHMAVGHSNEGAVVAVFQNSELFNPVDSGTLITLLSVGVDTPDTFIVMGLTSGSFTNDNPSHVHFADGRLLPPSLPVGQVRDETAGASGVHDLLFGIDYFRANLYEPRKAVAVLSPGTGWSVGCISANTALIVNYTWIERPAEQSELSL